MDERYGVNGDSQDDTISTRSIAGRVAQITGLILLGLLALTVFLRQYVFSNGGTVQISGLVLFWRDFLFYGRETSQISPFAPIAACVCLCVCLFHVVLGAVLIRKRISISRTEIVVGRAFSLPLRVNWTDIRAVRLERPSLIRTLFVSPVMNLGLDDSITVTLSDGQEFVIILEYFSRDDRPRVRSAFVNNVADGTSISRSLLEQWGHCDAGEVRDKGNSDRKLKNASRKPQRWVLLVALYASKLVIDGGYVAAHFLLFGACLAGGNPYDCPIIGAIILPAVIGGTIGRLLVPQGWRELKALRALALCEGKGGCQ